MPCRSDISFGLFFYSGRLGHHDLHQYDAHCKFAGFLDDLLRPRVAVNSVARIRSFCIVWDRIVLNLW